MPRYPEDCPACCEVDDFCEDHEFLAEPDGERGHKEADL